MESNTITPITSNINSESGSEVAESPFFEEDVVAQQFFLGRLPKEERQWIIHNKEPNTQSVAAIEIQRLWRGLRVRCKLGTLVDQLITDIQNVEEPSLTQIQDQLTAPSSKETPSRTGKEGLSRTQSNASSRQLSPQHAEVRRPEDTTLKITPPKRGRRLNNDYSGSPYTFADERRLPILRDPLKQIPKFLRPWAKIIDRRRSVVSSHPRQSCVVGKRKRESRRERGETSAEGTRSDDFAIPATLLKMTKKSASRLALEASYDRYVQKSLERGESSASMMQFLDYCAYRIQIWWLMKHRVFLRERFIQRLQDLQNKAAVASSAVVEAMITEPSEPVRKKRRGPTTDRDAAICIQRAWRRHIDIQVYRYYRDLINFKTRGNPAIMLRCINPNEARLLDAASGTSVRFRLAGDRFPPNIYYKIFTNRPVQDMCANSPKDYTKAQAKQLNVRHRHNDVAVIPQQQDDKGGWYQRFENNGWRLVSDRLIHHIMNDPITWETSKKTYQFDHSKLKRRQDVEKQKKTKKIEWMKKMYKQGMLRARADDQETVQLIEGAAAGMMATVDHQGPEALEDWEVDELLDWTTSLNFEEYFSTWQDLATSAVADNQLEKSMSIGTSKSDPYELTVSTAPSRFQSTRQSHHTTATLTSGSIHVKT